MIMHYNLIESTPCGRCSLCQAVDLQAQSGERSARRVARGALLTAAVQCCSGAVQSLPYVGFSGEGIAVEGSAVDGLVESGERTRTNMYVVNCGAVHVAMMGRRPWGAPTTLRRAHCE